MIRHLLLLGRRAGREQPEPREAATQERAGARRQRAAPKLLALTRGAAGSGPGKQATGHKARSRRQYKGPPQGGPLLCTPCLVTGGGVYQLVYL